MVLQSSGDAHYIQTENGTLGSMAAMIGFENVYTNDQSSMVQLDYEQALDYDPDIVMCVGAEDAEGHKELMEKAFAENPEYWNSIPGNRRRKSSVSASILCIYSRNQCNRLHK